MTVLPSATPPGPTRPVPVPVVDLGRLAYLPVSVFAVVMGVAGTALAWQRATLVIGAPGVVGDTLVALALGAFVVIAGAYLVKVARYLPAVRAEWRDPVAIALVPTVTIAVLLLSVAFLHRAPSVSRVLWWVGAPGQVVLTLDVLRTWISDTRFRPAHRHPAWFLPVVGNLVVPLAGVSHAPTQVSWFFFSVGLVYWLALLPIVLGRLFIGDPMPARLTPTLAILIAPPAVAALAWTRLGGAWTDPPTRILLNVTIVQLILLTVQVRWLWKVPFAISAWAYSFPLAAATTALLTAGHAGIGAGYTWLGVATLALLTVTVVGLGVRTVIAVFRGEICRPDH